MKKNILLLIALLALGSLAWWTYTSRGKSSSAGDALRDFAIADTNSITRIVITDHLGKRADIERVPGQKLWKLNNKFLAREDAVSLLMKTFHRIRIRGNVSDSARDNMLKMLAAGGKKVEIYTGGSEPAKIYYVGIPTPDHTGTVMLLEIPGIGRSEEPYITHMEGFTGFLSTRFFTDENDWRYTGIFEYPELDFTEVDMINHLQPEQSFRVTYTGGNSIALLDDYDPASGQFRRQESSFDSLKVKNFLLLFKKVHFESYYTRLTALQHDSIRSESPLFTLRVREAGGGLNVVDLYPKRSYSKENIGPDGQPSIWDQTYFYGKSRDGEIGLAQTYNFGPLVNPVSFYLNR